MCFHVNVFLLKVIFFNHLKTLMKFKEVLFFIIAFIAKRASFLVNLNITFFPALARV